MKKLSVVILFFILSIATHVELSASSATKVTSAHKNVSKSRKSKDRDSIEYMNLSNPLSEDVLVHAMIPFTFSFSEHSPNTKGISYVKENQDSYIILQPGVYLVAYDLECSFGISCLRNQLSSIPQFPFDAGTGWTVELTATRSDSTKPEISFKKCTAPSYGGCISRDSNKKNAEKQYVYLTPLRLSVSHSQIIEMPARDKKWFLRLRSVDYPQAAGILPRVDSGFGSFPYHLFFFGNSSSSASPINLSIVKVGIAS